MAGHASTIVRIDAVKPSTRAARAKRLEIARAYLHDHPERLVTLRELARVAGMSSFHLARHFAIAFGMPPAAYHREIRLAAAAALLAADAVRPSDAARRFGFADLAAFSHAFKRRYGVPPSAMRRRYAVVA